MNGKELIKTLREGQRVYGTMIVSTAPHWPVAVKRAGADFAFIDTEHIAIDRTTLAWMCQTCRALGLAPLVRIPSPDRSEEHTSELQSLRHLVCRLLLEQKT